MSRSRRTRRNSFKNPVDDGRRSDCASAGLTAIVPCFRFGRGQGAIAMTNQEMRKLAAEFVGTFTLVTAVCGAALFSAPSAGLVAVAFAVGLSVLAMAYAVGSISGGHFNPAVTCGLVAAGRFPAGKAIPYILAQVIGGVAAAALFYVILQGAPAAGKWNTFFAASNTYGGAGFSMPSVALIEVVITAL